MKFKMMLFLLVVMHFCIDGLAQKKNLPDNFLGFGWIVGFGYDRAFFTCEGLGKMPTVEDFFRRKKTTYGVRVNEQTNAYEALQRSTAVNVVGFNNQPDTLYITPVIACFELYKDFSDLEMLQVYSYNGTVDSVFYRYGIDFDLKLSVID